MKKTTTYQAVIGGVLRLYREQKKIPLGDFAEKMGVGKSTWSKAENGKSALSSDQIARAAHELDVPPSKIWEEADKAVKRLKEEEGIEIEFSDKKNSPRALGGVLLIGAALGVFLVAALANREGEK